MNDRSSLVLDAVLRVFKPAARLLLQNGVSYGAFATALKRIFLAAAQDELKARGMAQTDSALTLLSGVHRRDVRTLLRNAPEDDAAARREPLSMAGEVVARWLSSTPWLGPDGVPRTLSRGAEADSFDELVASVSSDIRPRAVLDELKRLGVAEEDEAGVRLLMASFAPRQGFEEMTWLFADNLHDHLAAAAANLQGQSNFLEQSIHVDEITAASAAALQKAAVAAWKDTFRRYMALAQERFDADAAKAPPEQRDQRARLGMYFFIDKDRENKP
ncbi:MAG: DUF6502 family protein [Proteobacteria bacterium]|nr:DUF6502 family protein [Pseudomonadota bacterium]